MQRNLNASLSFFTHNNLALKQAFFAVLWTLSLFSCIALVARNAPGGTPLSAPTDLLSALLSPSIWLIAALIFLVLLISRTAQELLNHKYTEKFHPERLLWSGNVIPSFFDKWLGKQPELFEKMYLRLTLFSLGTCLFIVFCITLLACSLKLQTQSSDLAQITLAFLLSHCSCEIALKSMPAALLMPGERSFSREGGHILAMALSLAAQISAAVLLERVFDQRFWLLYLPAVFITYGCLLSASRPGEIPLLSPLSLLARVSFLAGPILFLIFN